MAPRHIPDARRRAALDRLLNRVFRRHDLQPPAVTRFTGGLALFWLAGSALAYALLPVLPPRDKALIALVYGWTSVVVRPTGSADLRSVVPWIILALALLPVALQLLAYGAASARARYRAEALRLARQQGRRHPADLLAIRGVSDGIPLGEYRGRRFGIQRGADAGHVLVTAPTRAGKGLHLTATLESWRGPAVIVDPKREQLARTSGLRADLGRIYCLPQHGVDILQFFNVHDSLDLQELFSSLLQTWRDHDPIFSQKAFGIFEAARDTAAATGEHMLRILSRWSELPADRFVSEAAPHASAAIDKFTDGDREELNRFALSAWGTFTAKWTAIAPHIDTISRADVPATWAGDAATIYLCYPLDQLEAAGGLLSVILTALMKGQQRQPIKRHTLFAIDELPTAAIQGLDTRLATVGGYGITILGYIQQLSQLSDKYGPETSRSIIGNFHHQIFYPTRDNESARYVSDKFGSDIQVSRSYGGRGAGGSGPSFSQHTAPALEPSQINTLPATATVVFTDEHVTIAQRVNPFPRRPAYDRPPVALVVGTTVYGADGSILAARKPPAPAAPAVVAAQEEFSYDDF
jgi:hypothetical protein